MGSFDRVVYGCIILYSLREIQSILVNLVFGCKVGGCIILDIPQEVLNEVIQDLGSDTWFVHKHRKDLMENYIGGIYVWDEHGRRVICKGLETIHADFQTFCSMRCVLC